MRIHKIILFLALAVALLLLSAASYSEARASIPAPGVMSGGDYVLTLQTNPQTQPGSYILLDAETQDVAGSGCCCRAYLPCIKR